MVMSLWPHFLAHAVDSSDTAVKAGHVRRYTAASPIQQLGLALKATFRYRVRVVRRVVIQLRRIVAAVWRRQAHRLQTDTW